MHAYVVLQENIFVKSCIIYIDLTHVILNVNDYLYIYAPYVCMSSCLRAYTYTIMIDCNIMQLAS
jgi:hypothetical protein